MAYITLTTTGAYLFVSDGLSPAAKNLLRWLFSQPESPAFRSETFQKIQEETGVKDPEATLQELIDRGALLRSEKPVVCPKAPMQEALPSLLSQLSDAGRALLVDAKGLCIASTGIDTERITALAALASKLTSAFHHAGDDVFHLLEVEYGVTCLYDVMKKNLFTFIPLNLGPNQLVLVAEGQVAFSSAVFRDFIWVLWIRFGTSAENAN